MKSPYAHIPSRIHVGELIVAPIPFKMAKAFVQANHYMGGCHNGPTAQFGLFRLPQPLPPRWRNGSKPGQAWIEFADVERLNPASLVGTIIFATPNSENVCRSVFGDEHKRRVTELHRLCLLDSVGHNAESHFICQALAMLKEARPDLWGVISFADTSFGHVGTIYQASNAYWTGTSPARAAYRDAAGRIRHRRQCGHNVSTLEAQERGWEIIPGGVKQRYLFTMPDDRRHKKQIEGGMLQLTPLYPYPKLGYTNGRFAPSTSGRTT